MTDRAGFVARLIGAASLLAVIGGAFGTQAQSARPRSAPINFTISNQGCFKGPGIDPYIQQAIAKRKQAARQRDGGELASIYVRVPSRSWRGLTVTGVGLHYESTSIFFREPVAVVRQVLQRTGIRVEANGNIPIVNEEAVEVQNLRSTDGESRAYGASAVTCGL